VRGLTGIAFDMDGVIFDSRNANKAYYNLIRNELGLGPMNEVEEEYVHAHAVHDSLAFIVPEELRDKVQAARAAVDYRRVIPHMRIEPGLFELLDTIRSAGLKRAVYTNRTTTIDLVMDRFGLRPFFDYVLTASDVRSKPHPEGMFRILENWGAEPCEVAYIGDSSVDALAAAAADVPFWAYKNEMLEADMLVTDFLELRACLLHEYRPEFR
jgi:phosphoglycolate phosphatase-like HAD superfamily hydrolase